MSTVHLVCEMTTFAMAAVVLLGLSLPHASVAQALAWRVLPGSATGDMGDFWTVRELQAFTSADCTGSPIGISSSLSSPSGGTTYANDALAFDGLTATLWQGDCRSCSALGAYIGFVPADISLQVQCLGVWQCTSTGCAPTLQVQYSFSGAPYTWINAAPAAASAGGGAFTYISVTYPSPLPTVAPSLSPTAKPSLPPSAAPSLQPSPLPTQYPTVPPTFSPSLLPSLVPTQPPTAPPSEEPTPTPTYLPTVSCDPGTYYDSESNYCPTCPIGRYSNFTSPPWPLECRLCSSGQFTNQLGSTECRACATGKLSTPERDSCTTCVAGQYAKENSACVSCEVGRYAPQALTGSCLGCSDGSHTNANKGATLCVPCDAGRYATAFTAVNCSLCAVGTFSTSGQSNCAACQAGTYADTKASVVCSKCASGMFSAQSGSIRCLDCPRGSYQSGSGASTCSPCIPGQYSDVNGSSSCTRCAAGFALGTTGAVACEACAPGQFQSRTGAQLCEDCAAGKYAASTAALQCSDCTNGFDSPGGSASCEIAATNRYLDPLTGEAANCPPGALCLGGNDMPRPMRGFWVDRSAIQFSGDIYKCPRETCIGDEDPGGVQPPSISGRRRRHLLGVPEPLLNSSCWNRFTYNESVRRAEGDACNANTILCRYGSAGPLCSTCTENFIYSNAEKICIECNASWTFAMVVCSLGLLGLALYAAIYTGRLLVPAFVQRWWLVGMFRQIDSGTFRVMWSSYQIIQSCSWNLDVSFPPMFDALISLLSIFSFDFLSLECITKNSNQFTSVLLWSIGPILLAAFNGVVYVFRLALLKRGRRGAASSPAPAAGESGHERLFRQHSYLFLMLTYLVLPPVSRFANIDFDPKSFCDTSCLFC